MYESPDYKVIKKINAYELRLYQGFYTIAVHEPSLKGYSGFGFLFQYISGYNQDQTKMKMTIPVINDFAADEQSMEFVIPRKHYQEIPQPLLKEMKIKHYPEQLVLVNTFTGLISVKKTNDEIARMDKFIAENGLEKLSAPKMARYNGPYTLPFLRHNEIWITVKTTDNFDKDHKA
jgi:hypothetical protein